MPSSQLRWPMPQVHAQRALRLTVDLLPERTPISWNLLPESTHVDAVRNGNRLSVIVPSPGCRTRLRRLLD